MCDSLLEAYGQARSLYYIKSFAPPQFHPSPGGENTQKIAPLQAEKVRKIISALKNGPNLMYDGLLEACGLTRWLSNKKKLTAKIHPSQGVKRPQNPPLG